MKKSIFTLLALLLIFISNAYSQGWQTVSSGTSYILYGMSFAPGQNNICYAAGMQYTYDAPGVIVKSTNGGLTWSQIWPVSGEIDGLQAIFFIDNNTGYAGGWNDYFIKTTDGGSSWSDVTVGTDVWYYTEIKFWDESNGVVGAKMNDGGGKIYVTSDGGDSWSPASGITAEVFGVDYADENTLFAVSADNKIYKSTDGGMNWSSVYQAVGMVLGVSFSNTNFGVVGGEDGAIYTTTDGGSSWDDNFSTGYHNFWAACAFEGDSAYVGGTDEDIYKTIDGGDTWTLAFNGASSSTLYRIEFSENNTGLACGSQGKMLRKDPPLGADFVADETVICVGGTVNFTDISTSATSWSWTFEGGNPSFSIDQNPTVEYANTGIYDVSLTVSDGVDYSTVVKADYISVLAIPGQANTPVGEIELCGGSSYEFSTEPVDYAQSYTWAVAPPAAGSFEGNGTEVVFQASESWSGLFTIKVKAVNICGDGEWSADLNCELFLSPEQFDMTGGGELCDGDPGIEIGLLDSETGVTYELFNSNVSTGIIVDGTGESISFGLINEEGNYTAIGSNGNCTIEMIGEIDVIVNYLPAQLSLPDGATEVCNDAENEYLTTGGEESDVVSWFLSPEEAGTISSEGMSATISWNIDYEGVALLSVQAENSCGLGPVSDELEIHVFGLPTPDVSGDELVCINEEATYSTTENDGNSYEWEVIGGTIVSGDGTYQIDVLWGNDPGAGYIIVKEILPAGCSTIDALFVSIDDCTGIGISEAGNEITIYPNPANSFCNIDFTAEKGEEIEIRFYNSMGQLVLENKETAIGTKQTSTINVENLAKGMYVVIIKDSDNVVWKGKFDKN